DLASPGLMAVETPLEAQLEQLAKASFGEKSSLLAAIAERGDDASLAILKAIQSGDLHYRKSDRKVVIVAKAEGGVALTDPVSNRSLGIAGKRDTRKITINNSLRGELKQLIAGFQLNSPRPAQRNQGPARCINDPSPDM